MGFLVAAWADGKAEQNHLLKILSSATFDTVFLVGFQKRPELAELSKTTYYALDPEKPITELVQELSGYFAGKIKEFDVGVNIIAGDGKLHTVLLASLLKSGLGIRLVAYTKDGVKEV